MEAGCLSAQLPCQQQKKEVFLAFLEAEFQTQFNLKLNRVSQEPLKSLSGASQEPLRTTKLFHYSENPQSQNHV